MIDPALFHGLTLGLGLLFLVAGAGKLAAPRRFATAVAGYRLLPAAASLPVAILLAGSEVAAGVAAISFAERLQSAALAVCAFLLLLYAAAMAINLGRGRRAVDCGCTTAVTTARAIGWDLVLRNGVLACLATAAAALGTTERGLIWLDAVTSTGIASILLVAYATIETIFALGRKPRRRAAI